MGRSAALRATLPTPATLYGSTTSALQNSDQATMPTAAAAELGVGVAVGAEGGEGGADRVKRFS